MAAIEDPTGFKQMRVTASRNLGIGYEVEAVVKQMTLDKSRIYQGWPEVRNRHTDFTVAQSTGLSEPNINGGQTAECVGELFIKFFGEGFVGGSLTVKFVGSVGLNDRLTARGIIRDKTFIEDRVKMTLDVWVENQRGEKVLVGEAAGFALD